jgi:tripartite-type tricarboxylate transporter receptor subunit TctC
MSPTAPIGQLPAAMLIAASIMGGWLTAATTTAAEPYPTRTVRILVGFGPGSTADTMARLVAKHLEKTLLQPVVVENRPGNSSMTAAESVSHAPNDGYTLFMATVANTISPATTGARFNLGTDLAPVSLLGVVPNVLVAHPSVPANDLRELVALARAKPDSLAFGTSGAATASHLAAELFNIKAGTKILTVNYAGGSNQALTDLLAGRITLMFNVAATLAPHVRQGTLKALAVAQPRRAGIMPDVATMDEQGMSGVDAGIWIGLMAPHGTPPEIIQTLSQRSNEALTASEVGGALQAQGIDPLGSTPEEFAAFIRADIDKWNAVLTSAGLR